MNTEEKTFEVNLDEWCAAVQQVIKKSVVYDVAEDLLKGLQVIYNKVKESETIEKDNE